LPPGRQGRDITVETDLYSAVISETGGGIKSFKLKNYNEELDPASGLKELIKTTSPRELPLFFSWGEEPEQAEIPVFQADREQLRITGPKQSLTLQGKLSSGLLVTKTFTFSRDDYLIDIGVSVHNTSPEHQIQGAPFLAMTNKPFSEQTAKDRFLFQGPAVATAGVLEEIKPDDLKDAMLTRNGSLDWVAYEDTYFITAIIPAPKSRSTARLSLVGENTVTSVLTNDVVLLPPLNQKEYSYTIYFGPKKFDTLKSVGHNLEKIINFGWFDILAKPMLFLLNFLYGYLHNYGWAIIFVTLIIKAAFWPIAHKGMKSMKVMQKLQPKMAKLREKYANDKERLNKEMIQLYQTYKVNPMGGCLPMLLQIPVFFALYKVLLQTIELRHAPFMLWITDLSAPDRLYIGFDIPMLGGLPVLTLLMGASMFLQQKMTPTAADPTQAKIMMFLPVVFTFMFLNFASGLVLYWFLNNLLSIAQQYAINKSD
jgi:YidC/Oxa1 family membrane protein insertase